MNETKDGHTIAINSEFALTEFRATDAADLVRHLNDRAISECTLRIPYPYTPQDAECFLQSVREKTAPCETPLVYALRMASGELIGAVGFEELELGHAAEIGYWLARHYWGRGIMTAAVGAACRFAQEEWQLVRITAHVFDFNDASVRVLEKNGFALEGLLRKFRRKQDQFIDSKLYALVR